MDDFLTPVSTVKRQPQESRPVIEVIRVEGIKQHTIATPEEALEALKNHPDLEAVGNILKYLASESRKENGFNLVAPEPLSASIAYTLATITVPDYWRLLKEAGQNRKNLVRLFSNPNGLGAVLGRLKPLIADCRQKKPAGNTRDPSGHIEDLLDILEETLADDGSSSQIWNDIQGHAKNPIQLKLMWKEYVAQTASGRLLSIVAEAEDVLKERGTSRATSWLANGNEYAAWLGRNMALFMKGNISVEDSVPAVTEICGKALLLGFTGVYFVIVGFQSLIWLTDRIVTSILDSMVKDETSRILEVFLPKLKIHEQRKYFNSVITVLTTKHLSTVSESIEDLPLKPSKTVSGAAAILHVLTKNSDLLKDHVVTTLTKPALPALDDSLAARRSVIAAIAQDDGK